ncbi:MAG TPA: cupin domain-containing protein [Baekduia sp.]|nr:cupin domain-containing protein [Baekduia sp.]
MVQDQAQTPARIDVVPAASVPLASYELPAGDTIAGQPEARNLTVLADDRVSVGIFENAPGTVRTNGVEEVFYVLEGHASIELDTGHVIEVGPGDLGRVPRGHTALWTFLSTFRIVYVLAA